ncbi:methyltransferase domain-containing protein [Candidatus Pacearchaeota archaeon]|nr:methyltransferase domain-containing protein [Candidatus Pacearchaeota archaeon]
MKRIIDLNPLEEKYPWQGSPTHHMPTSAEESHRIFSWFERFTSKDISDINVLDLGCGNGNFMALLNEYGVKGVYGVEELKYMKKARQLLIKNSFPVNVVRMDYYSGLMKRVVFPDGIKFSQIDLFHLYAYEGLLDNRENVLNKVFLRFSKLGDYFLVHPGLKKDAEFYHQKSLKMIFQDDVATLIQKT